MGFTLIDMVVLVVYLGAVLLAGIFLSNKEMQGKEFFKGDGSIPWYVTSVSIFATLLSPISFMTLAGNAYEGTWILWFTQLGMVVAIPLAIKFFLPIYARLDIDTAYDYLQIRFGSKVLRAISAVFFIIYQVGRMSIIMYLPSIALAGLTGINVNILIILMGVIAIIYSYTGGIKSVLWTDFIQGSVLIFGAVVGLIFLIYYIDGGFAPIMDELVNNGKFLAENEPIFDPNIFKDSVFLMIIGAGFNTLSSYISSQDIVQRFTTTQSVKKLNKMMFTNGILSLATATFFYLTGTGLYVLYKVQNPGLAEGVPQDEIFTYFITNGMPVGLTGILIAAIFAAAQSTLSTGLNSVATSWTLDIQDVFSEGMTDDKRTQIARYISLGVGVFSIVVSVLMASTGIESAYVWFNGFMGLVLGVLGGTFILGLFFKKANLYGAYAGMAMSSLVMIAIRYILVIDSISVWANSLISIAVSIVVGYIVSVLTGGSAKETPANTTVYDIPEIKRDMSWEVRS
ncbi:MAG: sodium:solute symporter [Aerococcus suis]|nr:sodium:solute symporter [Aerococcus suis]